MHSWAVFIEDRLGLEVVDIVGDSDHIFKNSASERLEIHNDINALWNDFFQIRENGDTCKSNVSSS